MGTKHLIEQYGMAGLKRDERGRFRRVDTTALRLALGETRKGPRVNPYPGPAAPASGGSQERSHRIRGTSDQAL